MYAQVITAQARPDRLEELSRVLGGRRADRASPPPGLRASWLLLDRATCKCLAVTVWASEGELRASQRAGLPASAEDAMRALAGTPTREVFEVFEVIESAAPSTPG